MQYSQVSGIQYAWSARLSVASVVLMSALLAACSKPESAPEPVRAVKTITVGESGLQAAYEYSGEVRARVEQRLGFRVAGKIIQRQAEVGQRVKAGQILAQLDPQDYKLASDAARAAVSAALTNRDLAAADFKRFQGLKEQNFISGAELERREAALKAAEAQVQQTQAQLGNTGNQVGYANLVATSAGIVVAVDAEVGQVVSAGTPVMRIAQDGPRDVVFSVSENQLGLVTVGSGAKAKRWDAASADLQGTVREMAASADPLTRTYQAKLAMPAGVNLPLGATVYVYPELKDAKDATAMKLPTSSLLQSTQGSSQVMLLDIASMTVKPVNVNVVTADGNMAVIGSGLKAGDVVVAVGAHVLSPGQKVTIYKEKGQVAGYESAQNAIKSVAISGAIAADKQTK
jgi:membrane fusion protein, multidrug efflux system